jgi:sugar/nucleoside kinase (ribokinase family)
VGGTLVANLTALGCRRVSAIGFCGDDGEGYELRNDLATLGCDLEHLHVDPTRQTPTYLKPRNAKTAGLEGEHNRYDFKNRVRTTEAMEKKLIASLDRLLERKALDGLLLVDQLEEEDCGVVTSTIREKLADRAKKHPEVVFWADSRFFIKRFRDIYLKANQFEALGRTPTRADEQIDWRRLIETDSSGSTPASALQKQANAPVTITCGAQGVLVVDQRNYIQVPAVRIDGPTDPTGAGDSASVATVLALTSGADLAEAALVGNLVASITIEQLNTTGTASLEELIPRFRLWKKQHACGRDVPPIITGRLPTASQ